jgi:hypothetical protein
MTMTWFFTPKKKAQDEQSITLRRIESEMIAAKKRLDSALDELLNETASRKVDKKDG